MMENKKLFYGILIVVIVIVWIGLFIFIKPMITSKDTEEPREGQIIGINKSYFDDDPIAQQILSGEMRYNMSDYGIVCGVSPGKSNQYGFKILNAIKQLGYLNQQKCSGGEGNRAALLILNEFQRKNGLPESNYVDNNTLLKLDSQIREVEAWDNTVASQFTCYKYIKYAPPNDASKNHLAFLYMIAMNTYPENLRIKEEECLSGQTFLVSHYLVSPEEDKILCDPGYWKEYDDYCNLKDIFNVWNIQSKDDFTLVGSIIHEHAHFIDANKYRHGEDKINTISFYNISYDISDKVRDSWIFYKPRVNMTDVNQKREHFFNYADGWQSNSYPGYYIAYEDFAVSMEMYVLHGIVFRDYMEDKPILAKKYSWIKENVFNEAEFNTGDPNYASYVPDLYDIGHGIVAAGGITELRPDYVWDYEISPILSTQTGHD